MTLFRTALAASLLLLPATACGQEAPAGPSPAPADSLLHPAIAAFAARLAAEVAEDAVGSVAAAVVLGDSVAWSGAFGVADRGTGAPATVETLYRVGSLTKMVTAAALMRLVAGGAVSLDEPVAVRVPEIAGLAGLEATDRPLTYADLASHTAGLEREPSSSLAARGRGWQRKTLEAIPVTQVRGSPGEAYLYSNIGYAILGLALERAGRRRYEALVTEEVLAPLRMTSSSFAIRRRDRDRLATGYVNLADGTVDPRVPRAEHRGRGYKVPNEGLYSTVGDLARLVMGLSGALGDALLDEDGRAAMLTNRSPGGDPRAGYGLGLQLTRIGDTLLAGHSGTVAGYASYLTFDPATGVGVIILRNYNLGKTNLGAEAHGLVLELVTGDPSTR
ncbi:MAG TPA: serine hydrolase domain-containing protein [Longimicrobiales bacterium]|nr:serine hydrolase domain-containing protein [Longimicrobiales bacterium]